MPDVSGSRLHFRLLLNIFGQLLLTYPTVKLTGMYVSGCLNS